MDALTSMPKYNDSVVIDVNLEVMTANHIHYVRWPHTQSGVGDNWQSVLHRGLSGY